MLSSLSRQVAATPTYDRFADLMSDWGYTWEAIEVPTADDYILTTFHITGKVGQEPVKLADTHGTVLIQHGLTQDAASWLQGFGANKPFQLQLVDEGYDIWLGNNRGTEYSQGHKVYSVDDPLYWDFDWADMGNYDDPATISSIKAATGLEKISYVGYSQGTAQMHYALTHDSAGFYEQNLNRIIHLAPCFYPNLPDIITSTVSNGLMELQDYGVYQLFGKNWAQDVETICENVDFITCQIYRGRSGQPVSVRDEQYWAQLGLTNGFYEPVTRAQWHAGQHVGAEIDVSKIDKVPMSFFIGSSDSTCQAWVAQEYIGKMTTTTEVLTINGAGHSYFSQEAHDSFFMNKIVEHLELHW